MCEQAYRVMTMGLSFLLRLVLLKGLRLCTQDMLKFGNSSREYVLLHERSTAGG